MIYAKEGKVRLEGNVLDVKMELILALRSFKKAMELEETVWEQTLNEIVKAAKMSEEEFKSYISEEIRIDKKIKERLAAKLMKELDDLREECERNTKEEQEEAVRIAEEILGLVRKARERHGK